MRIDRLSLLKYGRFTDRQIEFPAATRDFHLIVGPNEAGKSTLRNAIKELLFGIHRSSPMAFAHPLSELRLGAEISNKMGSLAFHRTKANKQTLRTPADVVLADTSLVPFLGTADQRFFEQMFGLDHANLVEGGKNILKSESDVGQILFQAAAGVASLGKVRDELIAEADSLWGSRKSGERMYFIALEQLEIATTTLKAATVRTKAWTDAHNKVTDLEEALEKERAALQSLKVKRSRLERVRRVAPFLRALKESEARLTELGEVFDLPVDATATLEKAERDLAKAQQLLELRTQDVERAQSALAEIHPDEAVLGIAEDVIALDEMRLQFSKHATDIERRQREIDALWRGIEEACTQLKWKHESEETLAAQLPTLLVRRDLEELTRAYSGLVEALRAAENSERAKNGEIVNLTNQASKLTTGSVKPSLRAALQAARSLGNADATTQKYQTEINRAQATLDRSLQALEKSADDITVLQAMRPPGQEILSRMAQEQQAFVAEKKAAARRVNEQKAVVTEVELKIKQYREQHHPTTQEAVREARQLRDVSWGVLKTGEKAFQEGSRQFEETLRTADDVADRRLDDVEEATALQSLTQELERQNLALTALAAERTRLDEAHREFDGRWTTLLTDIGLPALTTETITGWLAKRKEVLDAETARKDAQDEFDSAATRLDETRRSLIAALKEADQQVQDDAGLAACTVQAEEYIQQVDQAKTLGESLASQLDTARTLATALKQETDDARAELDTWKELWSEALKKAGLPSDSRTGAVDGALKLIEQIEGALAKIQEIRIERIATMNKDLNDLADESIRVAKACSPDIQGQPAAELAKELVKRLTNARGAKSNHDRLTEELAAANIELGKIRESIQTANADLKPLMDRAKVDSTADLVVAITKSDEHRRHGSDADIAKANLLNAGDGLDREQLEREVEESDADQLGAEISQLEDEIANANERQNALSGDHANASTSLAQLGVSNAATMAEAQRQEALSKMADAAERYVKVFTAGRLLRWAIDRYREDKQGPMLARAGEIFSKITLGSFVRLIVDFDKQPMELLGQRADGSQVVPSGMSDGTADQLYLALRLAALELHLEQSMPLPFIADDLFINFDDARARAGLEALAVLSEQTQVIFLSHHDHLVPVIQDVFGKQVNVVTL
jgi:uncharacterized protein YhaN